MIRKTCSPPCLQFLHRHTPYAITDISWPGPILPTRGVSPGRRDEIYIKRYLGGEAFGKSPTQLAPIRAQYLQPSAQMARLLRKHHFGAGGTGVLTIRIPPGTEREPDGPRVRAPTANDS